MPPVEVEDRLHGLAARFDDVRAVTESLAAPLSPEDQTVQSMADTSPTKWHRGHTSWFFETFLLGPELVGYRPYHPAFAYIFNSYYEAVGARHPRPERGVISRPGVEEVARYRCHVDSAMHDLLDAGLSDRAISLVELGLHHEQQHQELLLMDIKHVLSRNPLLPAYAPPAIPSAPAAGGSTRRTPPLGYIEHPGGTVGIGHLGGGFAFDNEGPRHRAFLTPFALADRPVTCGEWMEFMADGGYHRPELWLSDGWAVVQQEHWEAPLYWIPEDTATGFGGRTNGHKPHDWWIFTLEGARPVDPDEPVCHVSYYEADAYAHYTGARLPTETEWEAVAACADEDGTRDGPAALHPELSGAAPHFGQVWEWTSSAYSPYPGYRAPAGAVGEYNGKFMVNQYVLRGGCSASPAGHVRPTYRNFFPASARWAFNGVRLARDR
jgi:ergothioneine biosynthesis protein EgtB